LPQRNEFKQTRPLMLGISRKVLRRLLSRTASRLEGWELSVGVWQLSALSVWHAELSGWTTRWPQGQVQVFARARQVTASVL